jgi:hypothetical protein
MSSRSRWIVTLLVAAGSTLAHPGPAAGQDRPGPSKARPPAAASGVAASQQYAGLDVGSVVGGELGEGDSVWPERRFLDAWALVGRAGETVTVDLLSDAFDAVLYLAGGPELLWDDDGAGGCEARIAITFPTSGTYALYASTYGSDQGGAYTLRVTDRPAAPLEAD